MCKSKLADLIDNFPNEISIIFINFSCASFGLYQTTCQLKNYAADHIINSLTIHANIKIPLSSFYHISIYWYHQVVT